MCHCFVKAKEVTHFIDHVEWERHHAEVVDYEDSFEVEGLTVLHYPRPQRRDEVNVGCDDERLGERGRHEGPLLRPRVCNRGTWTGRWDWRRSCTRNKPKSNDSLSVPRLTCVLDELIINEGGWGLYTVKLHLPGKIPAIDLEQQKVRKLVWTGQEFTSVWVRSTKSAKKALTHPNAAKYTEQQVLMLRNYQGCQTATTSSTLMMNVEQEGYPTTKNKSDLS